MNEQMKFQVKVEGLMVEFDTMSEAAAMVTAMTKGVVVDYSYLPGRGYKTLNVVCKSQFEDVSVTIKPAAVSQEKFEELSEEKLAEEASEQREQLSEESGQ